MRKEYHKLVRDCIPAIIQQDGRRCGIETMSEQEYIQALKDKLVEEAREVSVCGSAELVKELSDLFEVVDSLMAATGIDRAQVLAKQEQRRLERGGFEDRIRLLWTEDTGVSR